MKVLIVESDELRSGVWREHLVGHGLNVQAVANSDDAISLLFQESFDVIVLNLILREGSALAVTDFVQYRHPKTNVIIVTDGSFFSDGSIFELTSSTRAYIRTSTPPEDITAMVQHYGSCDRK